MANIRDETNDAILDELENIIADELGIEMLGGRGKLGLGLDLKL